MHTPGAQLLKTMHPAANMCTKGAGCTLNFEHCREMCPFLMELGLDMSDSSQDELPERINEYLAVKGFRLRL